MNEFELIHAILNDLNRRVYSLEADSEGQGYDGGCQKLLDRLDKLIPRARPTAGSDEKQADAQQGMDVAKQ
jgi:hypothetical protein